MRHHEQTVGSRGITAAATSLIAAALLLAGSLPVCAADEPAAPATAGESKRSLPPIAWELRTFEYDLGDVGREGRASRFYNEHLLPRMTRNFERFGGVTLTRDAPGTVHQDVVYEVWTEAAERELRRATRRALRDYVLEETSLSRVIARFKRGRHVSAMNELQNGSRRPGTVRWDVGISHGLPRVDMRYVVGGTGLAELKFSLGGDGRFNVEFQPGQLTRTRVRATWLFVEHEYLIGANFAF